MGKIFSLALWWGAARWLSFIWVIRYFEEHNIKIDELSWTSIWAIIASLYAIGKNSYEMEEITHEMQYLSLIDLDMKQGLLKWKKVYKKLHEIFWDVEIQDLSIGLKIVATCVEDGHKKVFTSWKLIDAIRASISLPWIFSPHTIAWRSYIDGGIVNNLPIEVLDWNDIIAVTALKKWNEEMKMKRKVFWIDFNVWFISHNFQILQRTVILMMKQNEERSIHTPNKNIICIKPNYGKLEFYSFNKVDELIEVWYESVKGI